MKPNDKAFEAAKKTYNIHSAYDAEYVPLCLAVDAAFAAQFQSEDYAGLVKELREDVLQFNLKDTVYENIAKDAADALEALLAERDALKDELALRDACKNGDGQFTLENTFQSLLNAIDFNVELAGKLTAAEDERDALEALLAERCALKKALKAEQSTCIKVGNERAAALLERDAALAKIDAISSAIKSPRNMDPPDGGSVTIAEQVARMWEDNEALRTERDALLARLAPVEDESLLKAAAQAICDYVYVSPDDKFEFQGVARAAIAAVRPHIEAAERERCARIADKYEGEWHSDTADACARAIAAAIRSGK